jgi:hypothetical protein
MKLDDFGFTAQEIYNAGHEDMTEAEVAATREKISEAMKRLRPFREAFERCIRTCGQKYPGRLTSAEELSLMMMAVVAVDRNIQRKTGGNPC